MPLPDLSSLIGPLSGLFIGAVATFWYLVANPEKIDLWASMIARFGAYVNKSSEKYYMATNIQSTIAIKRKELGLEGDVLPYGIKIKWTEEESAEVDLKENKVLIMMKPFKSQAKNIAHVVSLYVPKSLLPKARKYVDPNTMRSLDYTIGKTILETNPAALEYYVDREIPNHTQESLASLALLEPIHNHGRLTRIIIPTFKSLNLLYPAESKSSHFQETRDLIKTIHDFETAPPGAYSNVSDSTGVFLGNHLNLVIVPVARQATLRYSGFLPHLDFIQEQLDKGITNVFIVAANRNTILAEALTKKSCKECGLSLVYEEEYDGFFRGRKGKMYCAFCVKEELI